jgi:hypothetical protein
VSAASSSHFVAALVIFGFCMPKTSKVTLGGDLKHAKDIVIMAVRLHFAEHELHGGM